MLLQTLASRLRIPSGIRTFASLRLGSVYDQLVDSGRLTRDPHPTRATRTRSQS